MGTKEIIMERAREIYDSLPGHEREAFAGPSWINARLAALFEYLDRNSPGSAPVPAPQGTTITPEATTGNSSPMSRLDAPRTELGELLHKLWGIARSNPDYVKGDWLALQKLIDRALAERDHAENEFGLRAAVIQLASEELRDVDRMLGIEGAPESVAARSEWRRTILTAFYRTGEQMGELVDSLRAELEAARSQTLPNAYYLIERNDHSRILWLMPSALHDDEINWSKDQSAARRFDTRAAASLLLGALKETTSVPMTVTEHID